MSQETKNSQNMCATLFLSKQVFSSLLHVQYVFCVFAHIDAKEGQSSWCVCVLILKLNLIKSEVFSELAGH